MRTAVLVAPRRIETENRPAPTPCPGEARLAAASGALDLDSHLTHQFPLDRLGEGFVVLEQRAVGFIKGWVRT